MLFSSTTLLTWALFGLALASGMLRWWTYLFAVTKSGQLDSSPSSPSDNTDTLPILVPISTWGNFDISRRSQPSVDLHDTEELLWAGRNCKSTRDILVKYHTNR